MGNRWATVELKVLGFGPPAEAERYRAWVPYRCRTVHAVCGQVATNVPILVLYRGQKRVALRMRDRLRRNGYRHVLVQRAPKKKGGGKSCSPADTAMPGGPADRAASAGAASTRPKSANSIRPRANSPAAVLVAGCAVARRCLLRPAHLLRAPQKNWQSWRPGPLALAEDADDALAEARAWDERLAALPTEARSAGRLWGVVFEVFAARWLEGLGGDQELRQDLVAFAGVEWAALEKQARKELHAELREKGKANGKPKKPAKEAIVQDLEQLLEQESEADARVNGQPRKQVHTAQDLRESVQAAEQNGYHKPAQEADPGRGKRQAVKVAKLLESAVSEGEYIGDLGVDRAALDKACLVGAFANGKPPKEPLQVKPFALAGSADLYVTVGSHSQYGHTSYEALPLYCLETFQAKFPGRSLALTPQRPASNERGPEADERRGNAYWGLRVRLRGGKSELIVGPRAESRRLTTKAPAR